MEEKNDCPICSHLEYIKIRYPEDLMRCIEELKALLAQGHFAKVEANFDLEQPKTPDGYWQDDVMYYAIGCQACGQIYSCVCDTYHGNGHFGKGK